MRSIPLLNAIVNAIDKIKKNFAWKTNSQALAALLGTGEREYLVGDSQNRTANP